MTLRQLGLASVALTVAAAFASQVGAQAAAPATAPILTGAVPTGICSININRAIFESTAGKYMVSRLNEITAVAKAEVDADRTKLQTDEQAFSAQASALTPQQQQQQAAPLQAREQTLQRKMQIRQRELEDTQNAAERTIANQLLPLAQQAAITRHCTMLLNAEAMIMANPGIDITDSAMASLNVKLTQFPIEREHLDQGAAGAPQR
jgi:Skp family chaperone for outer membrane proteins